jgi:tRNA pseudouridine55 synthase
MSSVGAGGVLVVDKPAGMTSHDVVARVRRLLGTRRVGHAGTLDPLATGVLVVLVGEATKLGAYLTAQRKRYEARIAFGRATDTLDAEGATTRSAEVPAWLLAEIAAPPREGRIASALGAERARSEQVPPAYSAIHVEGQRSYERARAGEAISLAARPVTVEALGVTGSGVPKLPDLPFVDLYLDVGKGYYVRSLAHDLGERLGVPTHLAALRRTASGPFTLDRAARLDDGPDALRSALQPLAEAAAEALPVGRLTDEGAGRARQGKRLAEAHFTALPPFAGASAWLDPEGRLVAVGARVAPDSAGDPAMGGAGFVVHRGFVT